MKKTIITGAVLLFALTACAQKIEKKNVPATVKAGFEKQYPAVKEVAWEKEGANYEAEFELNEAEMSVLMDVSGKLLETEVEIKVSELPEAARRYVETNHKGQKIKEAAKITYPDGKVSFEAEVQGKDLIFDSKGTFIK